MFIINMAPKQAGFISGELAVDASVVMSLVLAPGVIVQCCSSIGRHLAVYTGEGWPLDGRGWSDSAVPSACGAGHIKHEYVGRTAPVKVVGRVVNLAPIANFVEV